MAIQETSSESKCKVIRLKKSVGGSVSEYLGFGNEPTGYTALSESSQDVSIDKIDAKNIGEYESDGKLENVPVNIIFSTFCGWYVPTEKTNTLYEGCGKN